MSLNPVQVLKAGAEEERSETARMVSLMIFSVKRPKNMVYYTEEKASLYKNIVTSTVLYR